MEQQPNVWLCQTITMEHALQLGNQLDGLRAPRKRFSWCQGFLKAHKPPTRQSTLRSQLKTHHGSTTKGSNNTSSVLPAVSQPTVPTTDPISEKKAFLQCYDLHLHLCSTDSISILLCSSVPPAQLVEKLGPWLSATKQGMWIHQLPLTEQITCIGWLLYSAPEYNLSFLCQQIKKDTGIDVALCFCSILNDGSSLADGTTPQTKAIHLEVDASILPLQVKHLERVYASDAKTFPLSIKM